MATNTGAPLKIGAMTIGGAVAIAFLVGALYLGALWLAGIAIMALLGVIAAAAFRHRA